MRGAVTVGIVANPASGRDIRRLVSGASVFDNAEKGSMVYRVMVGLAAAGVERVLMMPAASGLYESVERALRGNAASGDTQKTPELELVSMTVRHDAGDTVYAVGQMREREVAAVVVLGGDGTNRLVARELGDVPLCTLSTGTNNIFPQMREATVAGLATGFVARGAVGKNVLRREKILRVELAGRARSLDCALIDVAVSRERFVGARALWRAGDINEILVSSASPAAVGLSAVAGLLEPVARDTAHGLRVVLMDPAEAETVLTVPLAPGLMARVGIAGFERLEPRETVRLESFSGSLALDGEREWEVGPDDAVEVTLDPSGPLTIDVGAVLAEAAQRGLLDGAP